MKKQLERAISEVTKTTEKNRSTLNRSPSAYTRMFLLGVQFGAELIGYAQTEREQNERLADLKAFCRSLNVSD